MIDHAALLGRHDEQAAISRLLREIDQHGSTLVIRGAAGVGKTAVLEWAAHESGPEFRVLRATGTPLETDLPFAALHQLLRPILAQLGALSVRHREALGSAFDGVARGRTSVFTIAMAALELLADVAAERPLLVLTDDMHWFDAVSAQVLAFVSRRLQCDPILLLAAERDDTLSPLSAASDHVVEMGPLDARVAVQVLDREAPSLDAELRSAILINAGGNPLALVELPKSVQDVEAAAARSWTPLTARLERSFVARVEMLDEPVRTVLGVAAASDSDDVSEVVAAAALVGGEVGGREVMSDALERAVTAGLVVTDAVSFRFRHPLVRAAVYQRMGAAARRAAHAALGDILAENPERCTWHRAEARTGRDGMLASELEAVAEHAVGRRWSSWPHGLPQSPTTSWSGRSSVRRRTAAGTCSRTAGSART